MLFDPLSGKQSGRNFKKLVNLKKLWNPSIKGEETPKCNSLYAFTEKALIENRKRL
jgi:hypothetical protein